MILKALDHVLQLWQCSPSPQSISRRMDIALCPLQCSTHTQYQWFLIYWTQACRTIIHKLSYKGLSRRYRMYLCQRSKDLTRTSNRVQQQPCWWLQGKRATHMQFSTTSQQSVSYLQIKNPFTAKLLAKEGASLNRSFKSLKTNPHKTPQLLNSNQRKGKMLWLKNMKMKLLRKKRPSLPMKSTHFTTWRILKAKLIRMILALSNQCLLIFLEWARTRWEALPPRLWS